MYQYLDFVSLVYLFVEVPQLSIYEHSCFLDYPTKNSMGSDCLVLSKKQIVQYIGALWVSYLKIVRIKCVVEEWMFYNGAHTNEYDQI